MRDIFLVAFLIIAIYYSFKKPYIGVAAWIWIALFAPTNWAFGFSQSFRLNLTIVISTALAYLFCKEKYKFHFTSLHFWVFLFCFWMLLSTIFNLRLSSEYAWTKYIEFLKVITLFVFISLTVRTKKAIEVMVWSIVLSISAYAAIEAVKFILSAGGHQIVGRSGIIADRNDLAVAINMCLPLSFYLWTQTKHQYLKIGLILLIILNVIAIVGTYSRGGFIGLAVLAFAMWLKSKRKLAIAFVALISLPIIFASAPSQWIERQSTIETAATSDGSFIGRLWAWKIATLIAIDNQITGGGFKATTDPILWATYAPETSNFGFIDTPAIPIRKTAIAAHNIYFQVLASAGFVGLFIFLAMLLTTLLSCRKITKIRNKASVFWQGNLAKAIFLSFIAYGITGLNVSLAYFELVYCLIGITAVLLTNIRETLTETNTKMRGTD